MSFNFDPIIKNFNNLNSQTIQDFNKLNFQKIKIWEHNDKEITLGLINQKFQAIIKEKNVFSENINEIKTIYGLPKNLNLFDDKSLKTFFNNTYIILRSQGPFHTLYIYPKILGGMKSFNNKMQPNEKIEKIEEDKKEAKLTKVEIVINKNENVNNKNLISNSSIIFNSFSSSSGKIPASDFATLDQIFCTLITVLGKDPESFLQNFKSSHQPFLKKQKDYIKYFVDCILNTIIKTSLSKHYFIDETFEEALEIFLLQEPEHIEQLICLINKPLDPNFLYNLIKTAVIVKNKLRSLKYEVKNILQLILKDINNNDFLQLWEKNHQQLCDIENEYIKYFKDNNLIDLIKKIISLSKEYNDNKMQKFEELLHIFQLPEKPSLSEILQNLNQLKSTISDQQFKIDDEIEDKIKLATEFFENKFEKLNEFEEEIELKKTVIYEKAILKLKQKFNEKNQDFEIQKIPQKNVSYENPEKLIKELLEAKEQEKTTV